jgi:hypothetical protein
MRSGPWDVYARTGGIRMGSAGTGSLLVESFGCFWERGEAIGVELAGAFAHHDFDCLFVAVAGSIGAIFSECAVYVGDGENACSRAEGPPRGGRPDIPSHRVFRDGRRQ